VKREIPMTDTSFDIRSESRSSNDGTSRA